MARILIQLVYLAGQIIYILIIVRVLLSWVGQNRYNPLVVQVYRLTEPLISPFRQLIPPEKTGNIDLSPLIALLVLNSLVIPLAIRLIILLFGKF